MVAFIVGHGAVESKGIDTVVPSECSITFFVEADRKLFMGNALAALEANSMQYGYSYPAGERVDNYMFFNLTDQERVFFETVRGNTASPLASAWFIGDDDDLNSGIALCEDFDGTQCSGEAHSCKGILGLLNTGKFGAKDVVLLACRELLGGGSDAQESYGDALDAAFYTDDEVGQDPAATAYARTAEAQEIEALPSRLERAHRLNQLWYDQTPESQSRLAYLRANGPSFDADLDYYWKVWTPLWERIDELDAQDPVDMDKLRELYEQFDEMDTEDQSWARNSYPQLDNLLVKWEVSQL
jgi:hypothetical protein